MGRRVFTQNQFTEVQISIRDNLKEILKKAEDTKLDLVVSRYSNAIIDIKNVIGLTERLIHELDEDIKIEAQDLQN